MDSAEVAINSTSTVPLCSSLDHNSSYHIEECEDGDPEGMESGILYIYQAWVPVILFFCALTFLFNVFIVVAARWMRRPLTPTMFFSLSLAAADAIASLNVGLGLVLNTLLPKVYKVDIPSKSPCSMLALEAVRLGAVIVTVVHLLALAINHYIGIARPLHYAAIMTKKTATVCIVIMWIAPNAALLSYFASIEDQGFQSPTCSTDFLMRIRFRGQYASFFFAPLFIMIFIYGHIFIIIRRHQASRRALTQHATVSTGGSRSAGANGETSTTSLRYHSSVVSTRRFNTSTNNPTTAKPTSNKRSASGASLRRNRSASNSDGNLDHNSNNAVTRNIKAIITTLLIVGTFILGWIPAVIWFIIFCKDCVLPFESMQLSATLAIGITVNTLIVLKSFLDPIIYTARMKDFKVSFHRMRCQFASKCFPRCRWGRQQTGEEEATMVHFHRSVLLANNHSVTANHSSNMVVNQPLRSMRMGQPKTTQQQLTGIDVPASATRPGIEHQMMTTSLITVNEGGDNDPIE